MSNSDFPPSFCADAAITGSYMNTAASHTTSDGCIDCEPSMRMASAAAAAAGTAFCSKAHVPCSHLQLTSNPLTPRQFFPKLRVCAKSPQSPTRRSKSCARAPHLQPLPFTATSSPPISDNIIIRTSVSRHPNAKCAVSSAGAACNASNADVSATSRPRVQSKTSQTCSPWKRQTSHLHPNNLTLAIYTHLSPPPPTLRPSHHAPQQLTLTLCLCSLSTSSAPPCSCRATGIRKRLTKLSSPSPPSGSFLLHSQWTTSGPVGARNIPSPSHLQHCCQPRRSLRQVACKRAAVLCNPRNLCS
jgi:hypothetical protein